MAVLLETSKGDLVIDLYTEECPMACKNFMKLCKCALVEYHLTIAY
jgi:peptidyl-prolyl cis-trans isomerase-like 4